MPRTATIRNEIGSTSQKAAGPAASRVTMLASVAYATDDITSLEKTARAFHFGSRSLSSSTEARGRPKTTRRPRARRRPHGVVGASAAGWASRLARPVYRKYGFLERETRIRRSPIFVPRRRFGSGSLRLNRRGPKRIGGAGDATSAV